MTFAEFKYNLQMVTPPVEFQECLKYLELIQSKDWPNMIQTIKCGDKKIANYIYDSAIEARKQNYDS